MNEDDEQLLRAAHASPSIRWGTMAPFTIEGLSIRRIGFADIPVVEVVIHTTADTRSLMSVARQLAYQHLATAGISDAALEFAPTVMTASRRTKFVDRNESSTTFGKNKMGRRMEFHFEIQQEYISAFVWNGRRGRLPEHKPTTEPQDGH